METLLRVQGTRDEQEPAPLMSLGDTNVEAERAALLRAVASIKDTLQASAEASDTQGRLAETSVTALRANGLWRMRLCRELGGLELPIVAQIEVLCALAAEDTSSAWCSMVANNGTAVIGATMPDAAVARIFADGVPACSIVAAPGGIAVPCENGYRISGTWRLASAIHHVGWVHVLALVEWDPSRLLPLAIPAQDVQLLDSWNVVGLSGTGSNDFTLTDYVLASELAGTEYEPLKQIRGTRRYDLIDVEHFESYEHLAFAIGVARRALRELRLVLAQPPIGRHIGDRELVQEEFGRSVVRLQAVEALAFALYARIDRAALGESQSWSEGERHLPRVLAAQASELAVECVQLAFRRGGLAALHRPSILGKLLRDMSVAANHAVVDDFAFASFGQHLVESGLPFEFCGPARTVGQQG